MDGRTSPTRMSPAPFRVTSPNAHHSKYTVGKKVQRVLVAFGKKNMNCTSYLASHSKGADSETISRMFAGLLLKRRIPSRNPHRIGGHTACRLGSNCHCSVEPTTFDFDALFKLQASHVLTAQEHRPSVLLLVFPERDRQQPKPGYGTFRVISSQLALARAHAHFRDWAMRRMLGMFFSSFGICYLAAGFIELYRALEEIQNKRGVSGRHKHVGGSAEDLIRVTIREACVLVSDLRKIGLFGHWAVEWDDSTALVRGLCFRMRSRESRVVPSRLWTDEIGCALAPQHRRVRYRRLGVIESKKEKELKYLSDILRVAGLVNW
ncbi:hypothetical protein V8E53_003079 [Lactarius tabidus]